MPTLYGCELPPEALRARTGGPGALAGARLATLEDGPGRGLRVVEVRSGGGLVFDILLDRAMDLGEASLGGVPFAWSSATGLRAAGLQDAAGEGGLGLLRGYSGLMTTCGLDHTGGPVEEDAARYDYPLRRRVAHPLHGRVSGIPAALTALRTDWEAGVIVCEGTVTQAAVFGEHLVLRRRITVPIGGTSLRIDDTVENAGFADEPHMLLYHVNLGWPLLDEGARLVAPVRQTLAASHAAGGLDRQGVGWNEVPTPQPGFVEQVWEHALLPDADGMASMLLANRPRDLGVRVSARAAELPAFLVWQAFSPGLYALGLEPATNHADGRAMADRHGELIRLRPGERRHTRVEIAALSGTALSAEEARLASLCPAVPDRFPPIAGLPGR